jgi:hypothetical protein
VARDPAYPPVLFFFQGTVAGGTEFFGRHWPEARAVADLAQRFFLAFGIGQGGAREMFGRGVWLAGLRALLKGNTAGRAVGDPWRMPGVFLVRGDRVLWAHTYRHAGDHPAFALIPARLATDRQGSSRG